MPTSNQPINPEIQKILDACYHDPFAILGKHTLGENNEIVRVFMPEIKKLCILPDHLPMERLPNTDFFEWQGEYDTVPDHYQLEWIDNDDNTLMGYDPYSFPPQLSEFDLHLFAEGKHCHTYQFLGANLQTIENIEGVLFAVWAPNAERVSVVGEFNRWDGRCHLMRMRSSGVWELFIPELGANSLYKFEIDNRDSSRLQVKYDPYGQGFEHHPQISSYVVAKQVYLWQDDQWIEARAKRDWLHTPMSIYEVHLGSWMRDKEDHCLNYRELAEKLVSYVNHLGFTHIELLPIAEHSLDASYGYQVTGFYAPTSRFGSQDDFRYFVDYCHQHNIGVFLDWVPGHFSKDADGLSCFDGTALYEYANSYQGKYRDLETLNFNYGKHEVKSFLISNALYWLEEYHIDGLRVKAIDSMLYLDYFRRDGEWVPNIYGGNENLEAIAFLRELNTIIHQKYPDILMMAEESTNWPQVTHPTWLGGLGFNLKWHKSWVRGTLEYLSKESVHRSYYHQNLTFGLFYAFSEKFILPLAHDEVIDGKRSLIDKMPEDDWRRFANLRLLYTYMWLSPGKKLFFMGGEFAQKSEWNHADCLEWHLLNSNAHLGIQTLVKDLNRWYQQLPALYYYEFDEKGFAWIDCHDATQSVISYVRRSDDDELLIILNFTPIPRHDYRIGVKQAGLYQELFNSDSQYYGGSDVSNDEVMADEIEWMGQPYSLNITLPPLAGIILKLKPEKQIETAYQAETAPKINKPESEEIQFNKPIESADTDIPVEAVEAADIDIPVEAIEAADTNKPVKRIYRKKWTPRLGKKTE
ncbi:MAG: 1,4-alpha-glucan branching protein GlgB [Thiomargarita sp.]|nr:1,4-alpha-glucan branching protein GlgB [Thiomargarita sp.]